MDHLAMSALVNEAHEYFATLSRRAQKCRAWGHKFPDPDGVAPEIVGSNVYQYSLRCRCRTIKIWTYFANDHTFTVKYDYSEVPGYLRKGGGIMTTDQRRVMKHLVLFGER